MEQAEIIKGARDIIAAGRWCQNNLQEHANYCAVGALRAAAQGNVCWSDEAYEAGNFVGQFAPRPDCPEAAKYDDQSWLVTYNDAKDTTIEDVVNLFDKALAELGAL